MLHIPNEICRSVVCVCVCGVYEFIKGEGPQLSPDSQTVCNFPIPPKNDEITIEDSQCALKVRALYKCNMAVLQLRCTWPLPVFISGSHRGQGHYNR